MMKIEVVTPETNMGDVVGDLIEEEDLLKEWMIELVKSCKAKVPFLKCLVT